MTEHSEESETVRDTPVMEQNDRTIDEALDGIVVQTRADLTQSPGLQARELLRQRLEDAGISVGEDRLEELVRRAASAADSPNAGPPRVESATSIEGGAHARHREDPR
ncbi:hypothetical protein [Agromyces allii]|uniref:Uncharacterized protein n=1 Tax=Agromyces allii TaxID=393607 RepID=A0ABP5BY56_9MICO|nr:hypothetical protein [Agromyces allii]